MRKRQTITADRRASNSSLRSDPIDGARGKNAFIVSLISGCLFLALPAFAQQIPVTLLQEDFQIMRHALEEAHGGIYRYTSKREMDRTFDRAYRKIDHSMTDLEFWRLVAPVVAHIKCG